MRTNPMAPSTSVLVLAIALLAQPDSLAQCPNAREFGGIGGGMNSSKVFIDVSGFQNNGSELAQFWTTGNSANGTGIGAAGTCDSQGPPPVGWWQEVGTTGSLRGIRGFLSQPGCTLPLCPAPGASLTWLIEDQTADGTAAGFVAYTVDETPAGPHWWDLARTDPDAKPGSVRLHTMGSYPIVTFIGIVSFPTPTVTNDYNDVGQLFHGVQAPGNTRLPASAQLASYDVMRFTGTDDPGRDRSLWNQLKKIEYLDAPIFADQLHTHCFELLGTGLFEFYAIGLTWDDGVESEYVGPASKLVCYDMAAQPELPIERQPSVTKRPGRSPRAPRP